MLLHVLQGKEQVPPAPKKKYSSQNDDGAGVEKAWYRRRKSLESTQVCKFTETTTVMYRENVVSLICLELIYP